MWPLSTALVPGIVPWLTGAFPRSFLGHSSADLVVRGVLSFDEPDGRRALSYSSMNFADAEHFPFIQFFQIPSKFLPHSSAELPGDRVLSYNIPLMVPQDAERLLISCAGRSLRRVLSLTFPKNFPRILNDNGFNTFPNTSQLLSMFTWSGTASARRRREW